MRPLAEGCALVACAVAAWGVGRASHGSNSAGRQHGERVVIGTAGELQGLAAGVVGLPVAGHTEERWIAVVEVRQGAERSGKAGAGPGFMWNSGAFAVVTSVL